MIPVEAWIYQIAGCIDEDDIRITGCRKNLVYESLESGSSLPEGPGLPAPVQHVRDTLTPEFREVEALLPEFMPKELEEVAGYVLECKAIRGGQLLKLLPWPSQDVCFEFSTINHRDNDIEGPHCQLRVAKFSASLGRRVQRLLEPRLSEIADAIGCKPENLRCRQPGWPLKQFRFRTGSAKAIAQALGTFYTVVYSIVDPVVRPAVTSRTLSGN